MYSNPTSTTPILHEDGSLAAVVAGPLRQVGGASLRRFWFPQNVSLDLPCGRFFMARCCADTPLARRTQWSLYLRRPLLIAGLPMASPHGEGLVVDLLLDNPDDPGYGWLAVQPEGARVNLLGPFGRSYSPPSYARALLVLAQANLLPLWLPAAHAVLDRGGRVTVIVRGTASPEPILPLLPLAVELRLAPDDETWAQHLGETLRWADQVCGALPSAEYQDLADQIRLTRFRVEPEFAHVLVAADLACGFGACLACAVPLPDGGMTRACLHGPIFPLDRITR